MKFKTIGILGGLGPFPTIYIQQLILDSARKKGALSDQDYPRMIILMETQIPDRTAFLLGKSTQDPFPFLKSAAMHLAKHCDLIIIPCNTAHKWIAELQKLIPVPIMNMLELTKNYISIHHAKSRCLLLATDGTLRTGIYQEYFKDTAIQLLSPNLGSDFQNTIMQTIYKIKQGIELDNSHTCLDSDCSCLVNKIVKIIKSFRDFEHIDGVILGCTELPLIFTKKVREQLKSLFIVDPMAITVENSMILSPDKTTDLHFIHGKEYHLNQNIIFSKPKSNQYFTHNNDEKQNLLLSKL